MKVNLNIAEDELFRNHVKELISGQVRAVLREQLSGIVAGELAKQRLTTPDSPALSEMVTAQVNEAIRQAVDAVRLSELVRVEVKRLVQDTIRDEADTVKRSIREAAIMKLRDTFK